MNRSTSAPPAEALHLSKPEVMEGADIGQEDPRNNPDYAAFFYNHSRLDPRLPPPLYSPGQSWQLWTPTNSWGGGSNWERDRRKFHEEPEQSTDVLDDTDTKLASYTTGDLASAPHRKKLVDMIQEASRQILYSAHILLASCHVMSCHVISLLFFSSCFQYRTFHAHHLLYMGLKSSKARQVSSPFLTRYRPRRAPPSHRYHQHRPRHPPPLLRPQRQLTP